MELILTIIQYIVQIFEGPNPYNIRFCSVCHLPFSFIGDKTCPECGKKTTPLDILGRVKFDDSLTKKQRGMFTRYAVLGIIAYSIHLIQSVIGLVLAVKGFKAIYDPSVFAVVVWSLGALTSAIGIVFDVMILAQTDDCFFREVWYKRIWVLPSIFGIAIPAAIVCIIQSMVFEKDLDSIDTKLPKSILIRRAQRDIGDNDEWDCPSCNYINKKTDICCKSCGRYR